MDAIKQVFSCCISSKAKKGATYQTHQPTSMDIQKQIELYAKTRILGGQPPKLIDTNLGGELQYQRDGVMLHQQTTHGGARMHGNQNVQIEHIDENDMLPYTEVTYTAAQNNESTFQYNEQPQLPVYAKEPMPTEEELNLRSSYGVLKGISQPLRVGEDRQLKDFFQIKISEEFRYYSTNTIEGYQVLAMPEQDVYQQGNNDAVSRYRDEWQDPNAKVSEYFQQALTAGGAPYYGQSVTERVSKMGLHSGGTSQLGLNFQ
ncbi:hypothetical protein FGO68_gene14917 [Halteria grandinella]|uniref:Uncharacterized protein n=1 Tax=Halteria grandinella TaxID=5974 RepID=A0A8J8NIC9_HALGN|nr:hypothetical protein FGO68_gene14917 [Halteria grandinella]